jgi:hypothetical protein
MAFDFHKTYTEMCKLELTIIDKIAELGKPILEDTEMPEEEKSLRMGFIAALRLAKAPLEELLDPSDIEAEDITGGRDVEIQSEPASQ